MHFCSTGYQGEASLYKQEGINPVGKILSHFCK